MLFNCINNNNNDDDNDDGDEAVTMHVQIPNVFYMKILKHHLSEKKITTTTNTNVIAFVSRYERKKFPPQNST